MEGCVSIKRDIWLLEESILAAQPSNKTDKLLAFDQERVHLDFDWGQKKHRIEV